MSNVILHESTKNIVKKSIKQILSKTGISSELTQDAYNCFVLFYLKFLIEYVNDSFNKEYKNKQQAPFKQNAVLTDKFQQMDLAPLSEITGFSNQQLVLDDVVNNTVLSQLVLFKKLYRYDAQKRFNLLSIQYSYNYTYDNITDDELKAIDTSVKFPLETKPIHEEFQLMNFIINGDSFIMSKSKERNLLNSFQHIIQPLYNYYSKKNKSDPVILMLKGVISQQLAYKDNVPFKKMFMEGNALQLSIDGVSSSTILFDLENNLIPDIRYGIYLISNDQSSVMDSFIITNPIFFNNTMAEKIVIDSRDATNPIHRIVI